MEPLADLAQRCYNSLTKWQALAQPGVPFSSQWAGWQDYVLAAREYGQALAKASKDQSQSEMLRRFEAILREEVERLPRGKRASRAQVEAAVRRASQRVSEELSIAFKDQAEKAYRGALDNVSRDVGVQLEFGGTHVRALRTAIAGEGLAEAFAGFSQSIARKFNDLIEAAYLRGKVSPGELVTQMIDASHWMFRDRLETIARTETYKVWTTAAYNGYREAELIRGEKFHYEFGTRSDYKTCVICADIMDAIPQGGMEMDKLVALMKRIIARHLPNWDSTRDSPFPVPHPRCRHRLLRVQTIKVTT